MTIRAKVAAHSVSAGHFAETENYYHIFSDDHCRLIGEDCHYKIIQACFNIKSMFRQEYANLSIFVGLDPQQIGLLSPFMEEVRYSMDTVVFDQGQLADCLFILLEGEVIINYKPYDGPPLTVAHIFPGGVFGWSSVLGHDQYSSGAVVVKECAAYRIRSQSLKRICEYYPETGGALLERLAGVIAERLRNTHAIILGMLNQGMDANGSGLKGTVKNE